MGAALQTWITVLAGPILTLMVLGVWRYQDTTSDRIQALDTHITVLDTKFDTKIDALDKKFDTKFDVLNKLLTDNLIILNRDMGEIKGASHKHVPSN